jgi:5'-nucleotidase
MPNLIFQNQPQFFQKLNQIKQAGKDKLHVLSDFDRTLTYSKVDEKSKPSIIAHLRDNGYLSRDYANKAKALFEAYHPIEVDPHIDFEEKKVKMKEWWEAHYALLIEEGLSLADIKKAAKEVEIKLREGVGDFFDYLKENRIPLIILSAAGSAEMIEEYLKKQSLFYPNISIIGNYFFFDKNGKAKGIKKPIVHILNKNETVIKNYPVYEKIKDRKNVILLGDSLADVQMIEGFEYENLIKIGFLNEKIKENLAAYQKEFDLLILNNGDFRDLFKLLKF